MKKCSCIKTKTPKKRPSIPEPYIEGMRSEDHIQPLNDDYWRDIEKNPPEDGQLVRVRAVVDRHAWHLPTCKFADFVVIARQDDEKPLPTLWKPLEGAKNYWDERPRNKKNKQKKVHKKEADKS